LCIAAGKREDDADEEAEQLSQKAAYAGAVDLGVGVGYADGEQAVAFAGIGFEGLGEKAHRFGGRNGAVGIDEGEPVMLATGGSRPTGVDGAAFAEVGGEDQGVA